MNARGIFAFFFTYVVTYSLAFPGIHPDDEVKFRIVGGVDGNIEEYPYSVSIRDENNGHTCGGTLINSEYVITAAHCVASGKERSVVIGSAYLNNGGTSTKPVSTHVHPDFDRLWLRNDIAVLQIEKQTSYESSFPARMQTNFSDYENPCYVMGWGATTATGYPSKIFKVAAVQPVTPKKCQEAWKRIYYPRLICTTSEGNATCVGDSGGPLICENKLAGVVCFGEPCGTGKPDTFTAISYYNDWIDSIIN